MASLLASEVGWCDRHLKRHDQGHHLKGVGACCPRKNAHGNQPWRPTVLRWPPATVAISSGSAIPGLSTSIPVGSMAASSIRSVGICGLPDAVPPRTLGTVFMRLPEEAGVLTAESAGR
jgi:hypothetical protein